MHVVTPVEIEVEVPTANLGRQQHHAPIDELVATKDHFVRRNGVEFAGIHLLLDLWDARYLDNLEHIEHAMRECVDACNATLLHIHLHHFTSGGGISGVAVLAESHISVHTWPERGFAAFDMFMCGDTKPQNTIAILQQAFTPEKIHITDLLRGICPR